MHDKEALAIHNERRPHARRNEARYWRDRTKRSGIVESFNPYEDHILRVRGELNATLEVSESRNHVSCVIWFYGCVAQALSTAQQKIMRDLRDLEKQTEMIHDRTAHQVEEQARKIRQAIAELEESRKEWRTVTWKTMLPTYLVGVFLTF